jgi:hypothetical protein
MDKSLNDIPVELAAEAQQAALMRLQLYGVMRTHEIMGEYASTARGILMQAAGEDGKLSGGLELHRAIEGLSRGWSAAFKEWRRMFEALRVNAAAIPFGTWAIVHESMIRGRGDTARGYSGETRGDASASPRLRVPASSFEEAEALPVFKPQIEAVLRAANQRVYGDGFNLSQRIWKLDQDSLDGIRRTVYEGVAKGDSAWNIAKRLEEYLGPARECPRWTRTRLYKLTKKDIASGDRRGLYTGDECAGQGVSYNALRLARNEIQIAHHMATDAQFAGMTWVQQERILLSPAHPKCDICDDVVAGGENGNGIYPVGTISLPLHPQCLCYKMAVQPEPDEWAARMRGWVRGEERWPEMDDYQRRIGEMTGGRGDTGTRGRGVWPSLMVSIARRMVIWLWGDDAAMTSAMEAIP